MVKRILAFFAFLILIFLMGPKVAAPNVDKPAPNLAVALEDLPEWVATKEAAFPNIKKGNASSIVFADSLPQKTTYSIVYLHGFSGSVADGDPVHTQIADSLGYNIYLPRLYDHGLDTEEGLANYTGEKSLDSAREALEVGKILGEKVILMGTSTGCTLALNLATDPSVAALVLYAPNIRINHPLDFVATLPWGLQIIRQVEGGKYHKVVNAFPGKEQFWTMQYRLEAPVQMQKLLETTMVEATFNKIQVPVFSGFYYKNEAEQDPTVSVDKMREMFQQLGTPEDLKREVAFPNAEAHEIGSALVSKDHEGVRDATLDFLNQVLK